MSPRKRTNKPYGGQLTTTVPWLESPSPASTPQAAESSIKLDEIHLPSSQPRSYFDPQALKELVESVRQHGILQPLLVRPRQSGGYELVAGERRYRAATEVGLTEVPVVVRELSSEQAWQLALIENLQREDLSPIEETEGVLALLSLRLGCDVSEVKSLLYKMKNAWDKVGKESASEEDGFRSHVAPNSDLEEATKSRSHVAPNSDDSEKFLAIQKVFESLGLMSWITFTTKRLPLLNLPEGILVELREGKLEYTKAIALARVKDEQQRQQFLESAVANNWSLSKIKDQIKQQTPPSQIPSSQPTSQLPERLKVAYQKLKKTRLWEDPNKEQQIDTLLTQLEALLEND